MTAAASVTFFRPEFGDFLYAPIGADRNEMPLTVLSALSRLDVDPWKEAAELSELPKRHRDAEIGCVDCATAWRTMGAADARAIADRLIELLPHRGSSKPLSADKPLGLQGMNVSTMVLICGALGVAESHLCGYLSTVDAKRCHRRAGRQHSLPAANFNAEFALRSDQR